MIDNWLFALLVVGSITYAGVHIVMRANGWFDRRESARRNHAHPTRTRDIARRVGRRS